MSIEAIHSLLKELVNSAAEVRLATVLSNDGLLISHYGDSDDPELTGALLLELKLVCQRVVTELEYGEIEEIFIRCKSGCTIVLPIFDKGYLAINSTPMLNSQKLQLKSLFAITKLYKSL